MQDTELYRHLLGLESPWTVGKVNLDITAQRVDVYAEHPKGEKWPCPVCGDLLPVYAERIHGGDGLVLLNYEKMDDVKFRELPGVKGNGYLNSPAVRIDLFESPITQAGSYQVSGKVRSETSRRFVRKLEADEELKGKIGRIKGKLVKV